MANVSYAAVQVVQAATRTATTFLDILTVILRDFWPLNKVRTSVLRKWTWQFVNGIYFYTTTPTSAVSVCHSFRSTIKCHPDTLLLQD